MAKLLEPHLALGEQPSRPSGASVLVGTAAGLEYLSSDQPPELAGHSITSLAPDGVGLWAITDQNTIWYRPWQGTWQVMAASHQWRLTCLRPLGATLLVGTSEAHLLQLVDGDLQPRDHFEHLEDYQGWYTPWGAPPEVRSLALGAEGEWYVNVHVGGIIRSSDQGRTWQSTLDFHADVHEVRTVPHRPGWVVAATAQGLASSTDGGHTWAFDRANLHSSYARAVAVGQDTLLMSSCTGPHGGQAAVYRRSLDQAGSFQKCSQGLPEWFADNIDTGRLDAWGDFAAFGTRDGQVFLSEDAGQSWRQLVSGLPPILGLCLVVPGNLN